MVIDPNLSAEEEVDFIALVDRPAIQRDFMAFNGQVSLSFQVVSDEKRIVSGPAMLADTPIYRNQEGEEFYVEFSKQTIEQIALKFFKKGYQANFNLMHDAGQQTTAVTVFESFITDSARGIRPMAGYEDAPEGSWFISAKVEDDAVWEKVKAGEVKGFSVEGLFIRKKTGKTAEEQMVEQIKALLGC